MVELSDTTLEEKCVLGVLMVDQPRGLRELHDAVQHHYGTLLQPSVFELKAILERLESLGLVQHVED